MIKDLLSLISCLFFLLDTVKFWLMIYFLPLFGEVGEKYYLNFHDRQSKKEVN